MRCEEGQTFLASMRGLWKEGSELHTEEGPTYYKHTHVKYVQKLTSILSLRI